MGDSSLLRIHVDRPLYDQEQLNTELKYEKIKSNGFIYSTLSGFTCNAKNVIYKSIPILKWLPHYRLKTDFPGDLIAGITVAIMHIPQGMAYSLLGNVSPVVGIYMALFPVFIYFFLGTSKHNSMGTFAIACLMTGKAVVEYSDPAYFSESVSQNTTNMNTMRLTNGYNYTPMEVVSTITFLVGLFQIMFHILRFGAVSSLLSEALVSGFTTAASFQVLTSQVKDLFGLTIPKHKGYFVVINTWKSIFESISNVNTAALIMSVVTITISSVNNELLRPKLAKYTSIPVPIELIAVIGGVAVSQYWEMTNLYNISIVGHIPSGLPEPTIPNFSLMATVAVDALTIAIVSYAMALSMALIFAQKLSYEVDANQELLAMGAGNIFGSFFSCMPFTASISRSLIQQTVGGKTQIASLISCGILFCVIMWIGPLFEPLPKCILASVIVVSLKGMLMQVSEFVIFWKLNKLDGLVWAVTFLTALLVSIDIGLLVGLLVSLSTIIILSFKPYTCLLGVAPDTDIYLDITRYRGAVELQGIKIFHYKGGINFATRTIFRDKLHTAIEMQPQKELSHKRKLAKMITLEEVDSLNFKKLKLKHKLDKLYHKTNKNLKCLILDLSAVSFIDSSGVGMLEQVAIDFQRININVYVAGCSGPVFETIMRWNIQNNNKTTIKFFPTVHDAVQNSTLDLNIISYL